MPHPSAHLMHSITVVLKALSSLRRDKHYINVVLMRHKVLYQSMRKGFKDIEKQACKCQNNVMRK